MNFDSNSSFKILEGEFLGFLYPNPKFLDISLLSNFYKLVLNFYYLLIDLQEIFKFFSNKSFLT